MFATTVLLSLAATSAFECTSSRASRTSLKMGLDPVLSKNFPRDFKKIPIGTEYGTGSDETLNKQVEARKLAYLEADLFAVLEEAVKTKERPMFTTALIAGDAVILDALHKTGLLSKVPIVFVDTFTLFPETLQYLHEVENHYGFKSIIYNAVDCKDQDDYHTKFGRDYWMKDIDQYDMLCKVRRTTLTRCTLFWKYVTSRTCKPQAISYFTLLSFINQVEPMNRALKEQNSDSWINGRRRDHGTNMFPDGLSSVIFCTINSYETLCVTDSLSRRIRVEAVRIFLTASWTQSSSMRLYLHYSSDSLTHSLTNSPTHSLTYSLTHSLTMSYSRR